MFRGHIGFEVKSAQKLEMIIVGATDLGYSFAPLEQPAYRMSVIKAMDKAISAHDKLAMWLPSSTLETMRFENVVRNLIVLSRVEVSENEARHYSALFRQIGYCRIWTGWFMEWFKQEYPPAPNVAAENIRLVFQARDGGLLNDEYIRKSRELPWDEIHRYAPP